MSVMGGLVNTVHTIQTAGVHTIHSVSHVVSVPISYDYSKVKSKTRYVAVEYVRPIALFISMAVGVGFFGANTYDTFRKTFAQGVCGMQIYNERDRWQEAKDYTGNKLQDTKNYAVGVMDKLTGEDKIKAEAARKAEEERQKRIKEEEANKPLIDKAFDLFGRKK